MRFTWRKDKERSNVSKHGHDFSLAERVFVDTVCDGFVNGEKRWRAIGALAIVEGFKVIVVVYAYPNQADDEWVHVISLREVTAHERKRYEISYL